MKKSAALLPLLLLSCAAVTPPAAPPTARELAPLLSKNRCSANVLMTGRATITVDGSPLPTRASLLVSRPARLRLTLADTLGSTWFLATADEEVLFYAAPSQGTSETLPRHGDSPIWLGGKRYWAEDFIDNLPPCLDPALLRDSNAGYSDGILMQEKEGIQRRWKFYPDGRIKNVLLLRPAAPPIRFEFAYAEDGMGFSVTINRSAEFHFTRVTEIDTPPDSAFRPPGIK